MYGQKKNNKFKEGFYDFFVKIEGLSGAADMLTVSGRIQSREYEKQTDTGTETKTAYEVSISEIEMIMDKKKENIEQ